MSAGRVPGRGASLVVAMALFLALGACLVIVEMAGVPQEAPPPRGSMTASNPNRLVSANLKVGETLPLDLYTLPGAVAWMLVSSNTGPSSIGPYPVDLGPDWQVLVGPFATGAGFHWSVPIAVPMLPELVGLEFTVQSAVVFPPNPGVMFSNAVTLRGSDAGKRVLVMRQVAGGSMPSATAQADALADALVVLGAAVSVADDVLPANLLDYDCILDLRFTTPPDETEGARFVQFLRQSGGLFFVAGPWDACLPGQQRAAWIGEFLTATLGVETWIGPGGTQSNATYEHVHAGADPALLVMPTSIANLPVRVRDEGGHFGPLASVTAGVPWAVGDPAGGSLVYGMVFQPSAMVAQTVGGRVAVLFSGAPDTFTATWDDAAPALVMLNLVHYLDR